MASLKGNFANPSGIRIGTSAFPTGSTPTAAELNERFVTRLYKDVLNRQATPAAIVSFVNMLNSGAPRSQVVQAVCSSPAAIAAPGAISPNSLVNGVVDGLFTRFLGRSATPIDQMIGVPLRSQVLTIMVYILSSEEYFAEATSS